MKAVSNFFKRLNKIILTICGFFLAAAAALASVNAILRFTRGAGFTLTEEMCVYLIALTVFLMMGYLEFTDNQLTIDIFNTTVKNKRAKKIVLYVRGIITLVFAGMLIYYGAKVTQMAYQQGTVTNVMHIPRCIIYGIVLVGMIIAFASWVVILICRRGEFEEC